MQGHIGKRKSKKKGNKITSWFYVMYKGRDPLTGNKLQERKGSFRTKQAAQRALRKAIDDFEKFGPQGSVKITVNELLQRWDRDHFADLAVSTAVGYRRTIKNHLVPGLGSYLIDELRPLHIREWASSLRNPGNGKEGLSAKTIRSKLHVLSAAYTYALGLELIDRNPVKAVGLLPVERYEYFVLTPEMVHQLLKAAEGTMMADVIAFAVHTGARRGELAGARWDRINFEKRTFTINRTRMRAEGGIIEEKGPKTKASRRTITLDNTILARLKNIQAAQQKKFRVLGKRWTKSAFIFLDANGEPPRTDAFSTGFRKVADEVGFRKARLHDLRHAHASILINEGASPKAIQMRLGHANIQTTFDTYGHLFPETEVKMADVFETALGGGLAIG